MMLTSDVLKYLKVEYPGSKIYNGAINKNEKQCIGIFIGSGAAPRIALGGIENTSHDILPVRLLVHWTENADICQRKANEIYQKLMLLTNVTMGDTQVRHINMLDSAPVDISRDSNNICEMVIRANIVYEK